MIAFIKAVILNLAIYSIWYYLEYKQFGTLQWNRKCDDVVSVIYFLLTWYLFAKSEFQRTPKVRYNNSMKVGHLETGVLFYTQKGG